MVTLVTWMNRCSGLLVFGTMEITAAFRIRGVGHAASRFRFLKHA